MSTGGVNSRHSRNSRKQGNSRKQTKTSQGPVIPSTLIDLGLARLDLAPAVESKNRIPYIMSAWSREFTLEFIELYKEHECLWKVKSKEYSNKQRKDRAYENLVHLVKKVDQNVDRDMVIKKINNLRSSFRKEMKKAKASMTSGSGAQDVYVPRLFYFEEMSFLTDQDTPRLAVSNMEPVEPTQTSQDGSAQDESIEDTQDFTDTEIENVGPVSPIPLTPTPVSRPGSSQVPPTREATKKKNKKAPEEELLAIACNTLKNSSNTDRHDIFGQHVASTIREMPLEQQIYAEKIISEVLFEGRLGNLSRNAGLHTGGTSLVFPQASSQNYNVQHSSTSSATASAYTCDTSQQLDSYRTYNY